MDAKVRDKHKREINYNKIYHSNNYGDFIILNKVVNNTNSKHIIVSIKFIKTDTIEIVRLCDALNGNVKDVYLPKICNVACIGHASSYNKAYRMWESMINRCYNINANNYNRYGGKGIKVCNRWLCFEYFLEDIKYLPNYNKWYKDSSKYHLDKDYLQQNIPYDKRIYSKETCCFLQASDNICLARVKNDKFIGVRQISKSTYNAYININNKYYNLGNYSNDILAAYNNAVEYLYKNRIILNNVDYINPNDLIKMQIKPKIMCIIKK